MEHVSIRTTASLFAAFLIFAAGFMATLDEMGKRETAPTAHYDSHLHFVVVTHS
jgi:hypothetical protein